MKIAVSIVSHGHGAMVCRLVARLLEFPEVGRVVITRNIPEPPVTVADARVEVLTNPRPKGFGANHNAAFRHCREALWCVLNPDVELPENPFPVLLEALADETIAIAAPLVVAPKGEVEDSMRRFPTLTSLLRKSMGRDVSRYAVGHGDRAIFPEWVAGMFMLFRSPTYAALNGFDEGYYLYYEDVDICWRAWRAGYKVMACPSVSVIHDARRASRGNWRHRRWHLASMLRFLAKSFACRPHVGGLDEV